MALKKDWFSKETLTIAKQLLGKKITFNGCSGMIVETEAYKDDEASHAHKRTERSEIMYTSHGHVYVYLIYGMYYCLNFTTHEGNPGAVLIRAIEPLEGIELMKERRHTDKLHNLCSGPGKLCQAFGITKNQNYIEVDKEIIIEDYKKIVSENIISSGRIGIQKATELEWRFHIKDNKFISQ